MTREELLLSFPKAYVDKHFGEKNEVRVYKGAGCKVCHNTGYAGRIGLFEVLEMTKAVREIITSKNDADAIFDQAVEDGMTTMLDDGIIKVIKGLTTLEEVLRVTKVESL